jgi:hypothetical protein
MRKVEQWSKSELAQLPEAVEQWRRGDLTKGAFREMFKNRSVGAIKVKFNKLQADGKIRQAPITHAPKRWPVIKTLFSRAKRELRILEGNTIVTYREV